MAPRRLIRKKPPAKDPKDESEVEIKTKLVDLTSKSNDKRRKFRKEGLLGLGEIYEKNFLKDSNMDKEKITDMAKITNQILHTYFLKDQEDRTFTERILNTYLVPYELESREKMLAMLKLFVSLDENGKRAFVEIQKTYNGVRSLLSRLVGNIEDQAGPESIKRNLSLNVSLLAKYIPDSFRGAEFLSKFIVGLKENSKLMKAMKTILSEDTTTKLCTATTNGILNSLGSPVTTNTYYTTIKVVLERAASIAIDKESVLDLLGIIEDVVDDELELVQAICAERALIIQDGLRLAHALSFCHPFRFSDTRAIRKLIYLIKISSPDQQAKMLLSLAQVGKVKPLDMLDQNLIAELDDECKKLILGAGKSKQIKEAIRCLYCNTSQDSRVLKFTEIVEELQANLEDPSNPTFRTSIVGLGHICLLMPEEFHVKLKHTMSRKIVAGVLLDHNRGEGDIYKENDSWCDKMELPEPTRCILAGLKTLYRWILGSSGNKKITTKVVTIMTNLIITGEADSPFRISEAEKSWIRLTAGLCLLRMCEHQGITGVRDCFTPRSFYILSQLMNDSVYEVRREFAKRLHRALSLSFPQSCLPTDFMGIYSLAGYEPNNDLKTSIRNYMIDDISRRRQYITSLLLSVPNLISNQLPYLMPDYMLVYSITALIHNPKFTNHTDVRELAKIKDCLWFILEPLVTKNDCYSCSFYKSVILNMKNSVDATNPDCSDTNNKLYVTCDIAMELIEKRASASEVIIYPTIPMISKLYFAKHPEKGFVNNKSYLPKDWNIGSKKKSGSGPKKSISDLFDIEITYKSSESDEDSAEYAIHQKKLARAKNLFPLPDKRASRGPRKAVGSSQESQASQATDKSIESSAEHTIHQKRLAKATNFIPDKRAPSGPRKAVGSFQEGPATEKSSESDEDSADAEYAVHQKKRAKARNLLPEKRAPCGPRKAVASSQESQATDKSNETDEGSPEYANHQKNRAKARNLLPAKRAPRVPRKAVGSFQESQAKQAAEKSSESDEDSPEYAIHQKKRTKARNLLPGKRAPRAPRKAAKAVGSSDESQAAQEEPLPYLIKRRRLGLKK